MKKPFLVTLVVANIINIGVTTNIKNYHHYWSDGKDSIERVPHCPSTELYNDIYIKNTTIDYFIKEYKKPGMDLYSTIKEYYNFIMAYFDKSQVAQWYKVDFEKTAMVIYDAIGQITDYDELHHPRIGIVMLVFHNSSAHVDFTLKNITSQ